LITMYWGFLTTVLAVIKILHSLQISRVAHTCMPGSTVRACARASTPKCNHTPSAEHYFLPDIWLAVHHNITFLLLLALYTNFLFIHTNYIKLNFSTCFDGNPLIIRRCRE
jgi:hypothetical protein